MRGEMKKILAILMILLIVSMISVAIAEPEELSKETKDFVKKIAEKKGINPSRITNIGEVEYVEWPEKINAKEIDDTNLALYEVEIDDGKGKPVLILTASGKEKKKLTEEQRVYSRQLLSFGFSGEIQEGRFLKTSGGVEGSFEKGYVMIREGSITGILTNLEVVEGKGRIEIIIYKNGEVIGFRNILIADSPGIKRDYDLQSRNVVIFEPGDVISTYVKIDGDVILRDVNTLVEITTD
ncbi:hypothetical protein DRN69_09325 [Candidatus Pacearchaeota archaeon]|nr:MAG: hypothetical protein DRN69_09325 [Candidatus Pacearchaeota archaeon]